MTHTICYHSKMANSLGNADIEAIFNKTYAKNKLKGVTGILLCSMGNFFQVLEGDPKYIIPLYEDIIKKDPRHTDIFEIINKQKPEALFTEYSTGFNIVRTNAQLENVKQYLRKEKETTTSEKIQRLLQPFLIVS